MPVVKEVEIEDSLPSNYQRHFWKEQLRYHRSCVSQNGMSSPVVVQPLVSFCTSRLFVSNRNLARPQTFLQWRLHARVIQLVFVFINFQTKLQGCSQVFSFSSNSRSRVTTLSANLRYLCRVSDKVLPISFVWIGTYAPHHSKAQLHVRFDDCISAPWKIAVVQWITQSSQTLNATHHGETGTFVDKYVIRHEFCRLLYPSVSHKLFHSNRPRRSPKRKNERKTKGRKRPTSRWFHFHQKWPA